MNEEFKLYALNRAEQALMANANYTKLQSDCAIAVESGDIESYSEMTIDLQTMVEETCYIQGFKDAISLMSGSNEN